MLRPASLHLCRPAALPGVTLFRAEHFRQHFARHYHDDYAIGVITSGALGFDYRGARELAGAGEINQVVPGEAHTGHPALGDAWSYRMFYLEPRILQDAAQQLGGARGELPFFRAGVLGDAQLAASLMRLHVDLDCACIAPLEAQSRLLALLAAWIRRHGAQRPSRALECGRTPNVERVRALLEDCWRDRPALANLARVADLSPYQLLRAFTRRYGLPPHAYLVQRQLREARRLIEAGTPLAEAAVTSGFADQSHLNRHFKRAWGLTPGQFRNFVQERGSRPG